MEASYLRLIKGVGLRIASEYVCTSGEDRKRSISCRDWYQVPSDGFVCIRLAGRIWDRILNVVRDAVD